MMLATDSQPCAAHGTGGARGRLSDDGSSDRSEKRWGGGPPHLLDMTTTTIGLLRSRDFHPLEWQLASLHSNRTCRFASFTRSGEFSCVRSIASGLASLAVP